MKLYEKYMKKCIKLAKKGEGEVSPNPFVGCVVLDKNGKEISNGYHAKFGAIHAEADALNKLKKGEAKGGTLIVNLEPCSHFGKTPPCTDLIVKHGLKTLVIGMKDPNPDVSGNGAQKCRDAGIMVFEGVLEEECRKLNEVFIKNMEKKETFVAVKAASTLDGKIATKNGDSKWITSAHARNEVQKIRNRYDAIMTTSATVIKDDPSMDCRCKNGRNPTKIILDRNLKTNFNSKIYKTKGEKIYIVVDKDTSPAKLLTVPKHINVIKCPVENNKFDLNFLLKETYNLGILNVLVEAGGKLNGELASLGLVDKIYQFFAPKILADKEGINSFEGRNVAKIEHTIDFKVEEIKAFSSDFLVILSK